MKASEVPIHCYFITLSGVQSGKAKVYERIPFFDGSLKEGSHILADSHLDPIHPVKIPLDQEVIQVF